MTGRLKLILAFLALAGIVYGQNAAEQKTAKSRIFINHARAENINITDSASGIDPARLMVRILPIDTCSIYIAFPDGGNMLVNTGSPAEGQKLVLALNAEFAKIGAGGMLSKMIGMKPRIDWIVLTSSAPDNIGGVDILMKKFDVKHVIVPKGVKMTVPAEVSLTELSVNEEIDLIQTVSQVKMVTLGKEKSKAANRNSLSLKLSYLNFSCVFLLNGFNDSMLEEYGDALKNAIVITNDMRNISAIKIVDPLFIIPLVEKITLISDGLKFYVGDFSAEVKEEIDAIKREVVGKMLLEARKYYEKEYFKQALKKTKEILVMEPNNTEVQVLGMLSQAQIFFSKEKYDDAKTELYKLSDVDPKNKEAKVLLLRIETILKMMPQ